MNPNCRLPIKEAQLRKHRTNFCHTECALVLANVGNGMLIIFIYYAHWAIWSFYYRINWWETVPNGSIGWVLSPPGRSTCSCISSACTTYNGAPGSYGDGPGESSKSRWRVHYTQHWLQRSVQNCGLSMGVNLMQMISVQFKSFKPWCYSTYLLHTHYYLR